MPAIVTLTTDFGTVDGFVGAVKGVLLSLCPKARIVDITHEISAQDVLSAALALEAAVPFFPPGSVHLAVVDPGVGTARQALAIRTNRGCFVGPDNGLFELVLRRFSPEEVVRIVPERVAVGPVAPTFHARDLFAPAAARIVEGRPLAEIGVSARLQASLSLPVPVPSEKGLSGEVIHADRFGNLVTNLTSAEMPETPRSFRLGGCGEQSRTISVARTYGDVPKGAAFAYLGSGGRWEIGVNCGSAAEELGTAIGAFVEAEFEHLDAGRLG